MPSIVINRGTGEPDRYPLPEELSYGEMRVIKSLTGLMPAQLDDALENGDGGFIVALAVISAARAGRDPDTTALDALPFGAITVEDDPDERPTEAAAAAPVQPEATTPDSGGNPS